MCKAKSQSLRIVLLQVAWSSIDAKRSHDIGYGEVSRIEHFCCWFDGIH